jgi:uncharacterized protein YlxW (UPF0749 family)
MDNRDGLALLDHIAATALDDDYYVYREPRPHRRGLVRSGVLAAVLVAGGLVAAPAALQVRDERSAAELERQTLVDDVADTQSVEQRNRAIVEQLRQEMSVLQRDRNRTPTDLRAVATVAGAVAVRGPGIRMRISNGSGESGTVTDTDLQILANGLWHAGAEAVSIDGERLGTLTSIRAAGDAITVNYRSIRTPYEVLAVGDPEEMLARFDQSPIGLYWEARRRRSGIGFDMTPLPDVRMPAVPPLRMVVAHAEVLAKGAGQ